MRTLYLVIHFICYNAHVGANSPDQHEAPPDWYSNVTHSASNANIWGAAPGGSTGTYPDRKVFSAALSYFAYRAWVQGMRERDRMGNLYEAGRALFAPLTAQQDLRPFVALVQQMLDAQAVEVVVLTDEQVEVHDADGTFSLTSTMDEAGTRRPPEAYVRVRPGLSSHLAVIGARGEVRGVLASYREQPFSDSEKALHWACRAGDEALRRRAGCEFVTGLPDRLPR